MNDHLGIIVPTRSAAKELKLCIKSLRKNSGLPNKVMVTVDPGPDGNPDRTVVEVLKDLNAEFHVNEKRLGTYASWNLGAQLLGEAVLCFVNDDQYFAPGWDLPLLSNLDHYPLLTGVLVEPGVLRPYETNLIHNFGLGQEEFDEEGFLNFVKMHSEDRVAFDGFYLPTVIARNLFVKVNKWPVAKEPARISPDIQFRRCLQEKGIEYHRVLSSFSYHFQSSSQPSRPRTIYFERAGLQAPRDVPVSWKILNGLDRVSSKANRLLKPKHKPRYYFKWPKKGVSALLYKYCLGHGIEIGSSISRTPNVNTYFVDVFGTDILPEQGKPANPYELGPLPRPNYDFLIVRKAIEYVSEPARALDVWRKVVRDGGVCIFIVEKKQVDERALCADSSSEFSQRAFGDLLAQSGFEIVEWSAESPKDHSSAANDEFAVVARTTS